MQRGILDSEPIQPLAPQDDIHPEDLLRRDSGCQVGFHPCNELGFSRCCENTQYCIVNETTFENLCCLLGTKCGTKCAENSYYSPLAATTVTNTASTGLPIVETPGVCVARKCSEATYQCPEGLGGQCCQFGSDCAIGGLCVWSDYGVTVTPASTATSTSTLPTSTATGMLPTSATTEILPTSTAIDTSWTDDNIELKIGLGVGIPVAVIGFAALAFLWRLRWVRKRDNASKAGEQDEYRKPELAANHIGPPVELQTRVPELPAQILEAELSEQGIMAELPVQAKGLAGTERLTREYLQSGAGELSSHRRA